MLCGESELEPGVLNTLARLGSGFDIVSAGELERVVAAGGNPAKVVFSGVGKTAAEMKRALELNIKCFNVESEPELERLNQVAGEMGVKAPISLRINPDVDAKTHPYISTACATTNLVSRLTVHRMCTVWHNVWKTFQFTVSTATSAHS